MIRTWGIGLTAAKERAKKIFASLNHIACPFFDGELITFNRHGYNHLIRRGARLRSRSEQLIRLRLIEFAEHILKNHDGLTTVEFRESYETPQAVNRENTIILKSKPIKSWGFVSTIDDTKITLVISQTEGKQKEFLSIMAKNYKLHYLD